MARSITFILLFILFNACETPQNSASDWQKTPDLSKIIYAGGDGKSLENAIIIKNAKNESEGVGSEYDYIATKHGKKFTDWGILGQSTTSKNGQRFDIIDILIISQKDTATYYFDITSFFGKF